MDDTEPVPGVEHRERRTARTARLRAGRGHVDQPRLHGGRPDRLARKAALTSRWRFLPIADRIEIARFAIAEHLLTTPEPPEVWKLVNPGEKAISAHVEPEGPLPGRPPCGPNLTTTRPEPVPGTFGTPRTQPATHLVPRPRTH